MSIYLRTTRINKMLSIFALIGFMLLGAACNGLVPSSLPTQTPLPSLTPTMEECSWSGYVEAWSDNNSNGIREANEPPLSDIRFFLEERLHNSERSDQGSTGSGGSIGMIVMLPGCIDVQFEVYPEVPPNCGRPR